MRHPASGYVQGINDLVTPFFVVFLSYYICESRQGSLPQLSRFDLVCVYECKQYALVCNKNHLVITSKVIAFFSSCLLMFSLSLSISSSLYLLLIAGDKNPETFNMETLPVETIKMIEADSFWCLMKLLEGVQVCSSHAHACCVCCAFVCCVCACLCVCVMYFVLRVCACLCVCVMHVVYAYVCLCIL